MDKIDLTGKICDHWTVIGPAPSVKKTTMWECLCSCGIIRAVSSKNLRNGVSKSCGHDWYSVQTQIFPERSALPIRERKKTAAYSVLYDYFNTARARGFAFSLTEIDFRKITSQDCHYCGEKPSRMRRSKLGDEFVYNGIDRQDNNLGYSLENCVPCCKWCNIAKNNLRVADFLEKCRAVTAHQK